MNEKIELVARPVLLVQTRVSKYDRVSGGLAAGVVVSGILTVVLATIWLAQLNQARTIPDSLVMFATETSNQVEVAGEVDEPLAEELVELQSPELLDAVEKVDVVSTVRANEGTSADRRGQGIDGKPTWIIEHNHPAQRWQMVFAVDTLAGYSSLLDYLGVELAGVERSSQNVVYMKNFAGETQIRVGEKRSERRIYFMHNLPQLREWDLSLLRQTGLDQMGNRIPLHFYPVSLINRLYEMETDQIRQDGQKISNVKRTTFRIVATTDRHELELSEIEYVK
ncbi:MAG: hypothetical protein JNK57_04320 [Planctomycetaceae bacterium]|nr:hypothetical protein [Planctomycetaceae bacterium]